MRDFKSYYLAVFCLFLVIALFAFVYIKNQNKNEIPVAVGEVVAIKDKDDKSIGTSTENRIIEAYTYGTGTKSILIVGGIHGGYEWNSSLLAYELMDYFEDNKDKIPSEIRLSIIPSLNPDALYKVTGENGRFEKSDIKKGDLSAYRFNVNKVDLNRNFDCNWQATSTWRNKAVSAGTSAFSEKESKVLRDYVLKTKPQAVIFLHSQAGAVYASECNDGILQATKDIMNTYSKASGFKAIESFDSYKVTGDAEGWLASIGIPAITVELTSHEDTELDKNIRGVEAVIKYFDKSK